MLRFLPALGVCASILASGLPLKAQTCTPLSLVGGEGNQVTKTVSQPTIPGPLGVKITRNNWNTDWAVPGGKVFRRYVATITAVDGGTFDIRVFLKYSDQSADEIFNQNETELVIGRPLTVEGTPRSAKEQPFGVNIFVNGLASIGRTYTASVKACQ
ncbi:MAG: hypothetical protein N5P05_002338 [Chroococcopsis gigantea SAG 12.99]|jgi:hypothetical protein|nr:hypothetical protein [Chlorogloea purpurea SAG 13.99]MDV3000732.1 hypothetical protein [Chroococcopsis gigantea SAG 12.99]